MAHYKHKALQNGAEFDYFLNLIRQEGCRSYLEIGSYCGGSLWKVAMALPSGSRIVSVDKPADDQSEKLLRTCVADLKDRGYDAKLLVGDSRDRTIVAAAEALAPYDVCFIDGGHWFHNVEADWNNYGRLSRIVAFHDISWPDGHMGMDVPQFWRDLKARGLHKGIEEIRLDDKPDENGIGVLWRY